jgi:hypothetical protein
MTDQVFTVEQLAEQAQIDVDHKWYHQLEYCDDCKAKHKFASFTDPDAPLLCFQCKRWYNCGVDITGHVLKPGDD